MARFRTIDTNAADKDAAVKDVAPAPRPTSSARDTRRLEAAVWQTADAPRPKLISEEFRVPTAERIVGAAT